MNKPKIEIELTEEEIDLLISLSKDLDQSVNKVVENLIRSGLSEMIQ